MRGKEIRNLVLRLDADHDYFQLASRGKGGKRRILTLAERLAMADSDPAFLWNLASTQALAGQPLPVFVYNSAALRANCFLLYPDHPDVAVAVVQSWGLPQMKPKRNLLRALYCCADISLEGIAEQCGLDVDEVRLYEQLRWNFRDRVNEPLYIAQLLYPNTRFPAQKQRPIEQQDVGLRLCRLGYEDGFRAVLKAAGTDLLEDGLEALQAGTQKALNSVTVRAGLGVQMRLTSKADNPELSLAQELDSMAAPDPARSGDALSAMSVALNVNNRFLAFMQPDLDRRLALQRGLEEETATASRQPGAEPAA
jgi:hypothetical protein